MTDKKSWRDNAEAWMLIEAVVIIGGMIAFMRTDWDDWWSFVELGLTSSLTGVLLIWAMLGSQRLPSRIATLLLAEPAVLLFLVAVSEDNGVAIANGLMMLFQAVACLTIGLLRFIRRTVSRSRLTEGGDFDARSSLQFSIRWLLAFTAAIAILLAVGRAVVPNALWREAWNKVISDGLFHVGVIGLPMILSSVSSYWATRSDRLNVWHLAGAITLTGLSAISAITFLDYYQSDEFYGIVAMYVIHCLVSVVCLYVMRRAGWLRE